MNGPTDSKTVVTAYLDAVGSLDVNAIAPLFHDDGRVILPYAPPGIPPTIDGREAIDAYYQALPQMISALNFDNYQIDALEGSGDFIAEYTSHAKMQATGATYRNTYITRVRVRGGKIAELAEFFNPIPLVEALGGQVIMPS